MNPFTKLTANIDESLLLVEKYPDGLIGIHPDKNGSKGKIALLREDIRQSIECRILQVMLYGAYNAGKSTLVNALLGRDAAKVNDIPTTDKIDQYDWDGFHLLDTPGVNAPIEHEEVTEEQVKRSGAMLFVIREGDQDAKDVYERLFDMLKRGKKIIVVLNHQLTSQDDKNRAVSKINEILTTLAPRYGVGLKEISQISVYPVNVRTAYNGRLKNSEKLLEHSGYVNFIQGFKQWVKLQDNEGRYLETLKSQIDERWYVPVITFIESKIGTRDDGRVNALRDDRLMLESEQRSLKAASTNFIVQQVNLLKSDISSVLQHSSSQAELDSKLQHVFLELPSIIESWLGEEFGRVSKKLSVAVDYKHSQQGQSNVTGQFADAVIDSAKTALKDKENLKQALLMGRKLKIPGLKGRWEKTLGKWAGKAAIAVQIASFFYDIYKANSDQERENQQKRQQSVELYQVVEQICATVVSDMTSSVHEIISSAFMEQINEIQQQIDVLLSESGEIRNDLNQIIHLKNQMLAIGW